MEGLDQTRDDVVSSTSCSSPVDDESTKVKIITSSCEAVRIFENSSIIDATSEASPKYLPHSEDLEGNKDKGSSPRCQPSELQEKEQEQMQVETKERFDEKGPIILELNADEIENYTGNFTHTRHPSERSKRHKKKHRIGKDRFKKRKYRPYLSLSWREQQKIDDRLARRAQVVRDQMIAHGTPLAPYNTTQFIMNDHYVEEPDYEKLKHIMGSDSDWENEQFTEHYEELQDEYWKNLGDDTLAEQCIQLEDQIERAEKQLTEVRKHKQSMGLLDKDPDAEYTKIFVLRKEIMKLLRENESLVSKNSELKKILGIDISGQ